MPGYLFRTILHAFSPNANITATLLDPNNAGVPNELITFGFRLTDPTNTTPFTTIPNSTLTNASGQVGVQVGGLTMGQDYDFQGLFAGDTNYGSSGHITYNYNPGTLDTTLVTFNISPTKIYDNIMAVVSITLMDTTTNTPLSTQVNVKVDGTTVATPTTNTSGQTSVTLAPLSAGSHNINVLYTGDATHSGSSSSSTISVLSSIVPPPPPIMGNSLGYIGIAVLVAGAAGLYYFKGMGKKSRR